jgi:hypothetical protein
VSINNQDPTPLGGLVVLTVEFADVSVEVDPVGGLAFGRRAALELDTNRYLHRVVGRLVGREQLWWIQNLNGSTTMHLAASGRASMSIEPRQQLPITTRESHLSFRCGLVPYELRLMLAADPVTVGGAIDPDRVVDGTQTMRYGIVPLTPSQHRLLVALAEPRLRAPAAVRPSLPSHRVVAERLGWSDAQVRRKLDNVCSKFEREGVPGLHADEGSRKADRRQVLVDHVVGFGLVSPDDLGLLDDEA